METGLFSVSKTGNLTSQIESLIWERNRFFVALLAFFLKDNGDSVYLSPEFMDQFYNGELSRYKLNVETLPDGDIRITLDKGSPR